MSDIVLKIDGKEFTGWTGATVEKSLFHMSGAFGLTATDIFPGNAEKWGLGMGDECEVIIDDQTLITGYIEDIPILYDAISHNIQIGGRDKTGDLVDCSFVGTSTEWLEQTVGNIIENLCLPFGIQVNIDDSAAAQVNTKIADDISFKINEGESTFDTIFRLCKMKGILPVSYGDGRLVLTRTGTEKVNDFLELGKNVLSGNIDQSNKERFQTYIVRGQGEKTFWNKVEDISSKGEATDNIIKRYRPFVILSESKTVSGSALDRAEWERNTRAGKSRIIEYEVQGWTQSNGEVWPLNALVKVKDDFLGIDGKTLLIASISFSLDSDSGSRTRLTLVHPKTHALNPQVVRDSF